MEEKDDEGVEDGMTLGGGDGVLKYGPRRGARFGGEAGEVNSNWRWNEPLGGLGWAEGLAAPLTDL